MMINFEYTFLFSVILAGVVISPLLVYVSKLLKRIRANEESILQLTAENSRLKTITESYQNYRNDIENINKNSKESFTSAAKDLFITTSTKLTDMNRASVEDLLKPMKEQVDALKRQIEDTNIRNAKEKAALTEHINNLMDQASKIGDDAVALTKALRGNAKTQGNWGEALLNTILESSGLKKNVHYFTQTQYIDEEGGKNYTDVVVKLPQEESSIVIDSKVSLNAYVEYCNTDDEQLREQYLSAHAKAIKDHIDELAKKDYSSIVSGAVGFVLMFVANEASYIAAITRNPELSEYARSRKVILVSPANLITALQLTLLLWKSEIQRQNINSIIKAGSDLYDKFVGYTESMQDIGDYIKEAQKAYDIALGRLSEGRGNLLSQMYKFKNLGLQPRKELDKKLLDKIENQIDSK